MVFVRSLAVACRSVGRQALDAMSWGARGPRTLAPALPRPTSRYFSCESLAGGMKVTICGAAGCTGQPLALLLKQCPLIDEIALYDQSQTCGLGVELSHVDTKPKVSSYSGRHLLADALKGSTVVVIVARGNDDTFEENAPILTEITLQICNMCPMCFTIVATEPVECLVPLVGEIMRLRNVYNPRKLLGCVELHCVRANTVMADYLGVPPESVRVPVIGGATPQTMVPVLSSASHPCELTQEQVECVTSCIMSGTEAVCAAKGCQKATPCLAGAYAIARVTFNVVKGLKGGKIRQCAYVDSIGCCAPCIQFFVTEVTLSAAGVECIHGVPELTKFENCLLTTSLPYVRNNQARAVWLVYSMCNSCCSPNCTSHPATCYTPPVVPCVPPTSWTNEQPDLCRDEYLASICRQQTCTVGSTELCWRPRESDCNLEAAANITHQVPNTGPINVFAVPKSVAMQQKILERMRQRCPP